MAYEWAVPGAKVVCIKEGRWTDREDDSLDMPGPKKGDVLIILAVEFEFGEVWLKFPHDDDTYIATEFKPLIIPKLPESLTFLLNNPLKKIKNDKFDKARFFEPI